MILLIISVIFAFVYLVFSMYLNLGWEKYCKKDTANALQRSDVKISLIIPFQNQIENIPFLAKKIQLEPEMEIIFVNDGIEKNINISLPLQVKIIENEYEKGKKQALRSGIEKAKGNWIVQSDIDCNFDENWLAAIKKTIEKSEAQLFILPVLPEYKTGFWNKCFSLEFLSLVSSGLAFAALGNAFLCNGAALGYKKEIFENLLADEKAAKQYFKHPSGDDIFLLQYAKKNNYKIQAANSTALEVKTQIPDSLKSFFKQRIRWASKSRYYQDSMILCVAFLIFGYNLLILITLLFAIFTKMTFTAFYILFFLKLILDFIYLKKVCAYFSLKKISKVYFSTAIFYPIYIIFAVLCSQVTKNTRW